MDKRARELARAAILIHALGIDLGSIALVVTQP
jgi:hypothetical protein